MKLFEQMTSRAKALPQRIVLPEGTEPRTLTAADRIIADGIAKITLIGHPCHGFRAKTHPYSRSCHR